MTQIRARDVFFDIIVKPDDTPVRGNASVSGDDALDRACEDEILARLDRGDVWAWGAVSVIARWRGFAGYAHLGACSYADEEDFKRGGYYEDMRKEAQEDLEREVASVEARIRGDAS